MALTQPKGVQEIQRGKFSTYVAQDAEKTVVDWGQAAVDLTKIATDEAEARTKRKEDIETTFQDVQSSIDKFATDYQSLGTFVLEGATALKAQVLQWNLMVKNRDITPGELKVKMNKAKEQIANMGIAAKNWDAAEAKANIRALNSDLGKGDVANATEMAINQSTFGFRNLKNTKMIMSPAGDLYQVRLYEDPKCSAADKKAGTCKMLMPNFQTQNDMFLPFNTINQRIGYEGDAAVTDIGYQVNLENERFGVFMDATLRSVGTKDKRGYYVVSEEGMSLIKTSAEYDTVVKDVTNTIIPGAYTEDANGNMVLNINAVDAAGLANAAAGNGGAYKIATSVEQFKRENPGLAEKFMILVDPNAQPPTYTFSDKKGALDHVVNKVKREMDQQLDQKVEMTTPSLQSKEDKQTQADYLIGEEDKKKIGYLTRVQDIVLGDLSAFSSASARGIQDINKGKTNKDEKIDSIKRVGDQLVITYQSGRTEPVERKDANGKIRSTKDMMGQLFQLLTPYGDSYEDILETYQTGDNAKTIKVSARDMDDKEITSMLKNNAATKIAIAANEAKKGTSDYKEDYKPTPAEIEEATKGITITPAQILEAKEKGIPQTYVGGDSVAYSSREPYKIRSSGEAIIRGEGDDIPTITGEDALRETIVPTVQGVDPATTLPNFFWSGNATAAGRAKRKKQIDGAINKVFKAYLPSNVVKSKSTIEYNGETGMLIVKYKGKTLTIAGVTDLVIDKNTTFTNLDKLISKAAQEITEAKNTEFTERKGGRPPAY